ncbi:MAG: CU044_2847 family protein [Prochloraceae cyanobacterium]
MQNRTQIVPVQINENITVMVEARGLGGEQDVSSQLLDFEGVTDAIEALTGAIATTINKVKPDKATVELGLDIAVKSGKLTALLVEGTGKGNIKITLQWGQ